MARYKGLLESEKRLQTLSGWRKQHTYLTSDQTIEWKRRWFLTIRKALGYQNPHIIGFMPDNELLALMEAACYLPPGSTVVEVGALMGKSTRGLLAGCILSDSQLYVLDLFTGELPGEETDDFDMRGFFKGDLEPIFWNNLFMFGEEDTKRVHILRGDHFEKAKTWSYGGIDILFEDADHTRCRQSIEAWEKHLKPHGMIIFHDVAREKTYGIDGPINTFTSLLMQREWKQYASQGLLQGVTRDVEWWRTREEAFNDQYLSRGRFTIQPNGGTGGDRGPGDLGASVGAGQEIDRTNDGGHDGSPGIQGVSHK